MKAYYLKGAFWDGFRSVARWMLLPVHLAFCAIGVLGQIMHDSAEWWFHFMNDDG